VGVLADHADELAAVLIGHPVAGLDLFADGDAGFEGYKVGVVGVCWVGGWHWFGLLLGSLEGR